MSSPFKKPDQRLQYRCVGSIRGQYCPSADSMHRGILVTDDGYEFPALLVGRALRQFSSNPDELSNKYIWCCWPHTRKETPKLFFQLTAVRKDSAELIASFSYTDTFCVAGVVLDQDIESGKLVFEIKRNGKPPEGKENHLSWKPFLVFLEGYLSNACKKQFWEVTVIREGERLILEDAVLLKEAPAKKPEPKKESKKPKRKEGETSEKEMATSDVEDSPSPATSPKSTPTPVGVPHQSPAKASIPALTEEGDDMAIPGKLEVTIKINQLPEAKVVENNWRQFEIDCDGKEVTVTVKPKIFKKLEEAQANYPEWVAAITGQIGEATPTGFVLKEPSIQTFERKPKAQKEDLAAPRLSEATI